MLLDEVDQRLARESFRLEEDDRVLKGDTSEQRQQGLVGVEDAPVPLKMRIN